MAYIYKISNLINGKVYIGQTSLTPELRFNKHKKCYKSNSCPKLYNAMRKYGKENFIVETICETNTPDEDEKYWIQYYKSVENGYNITYGGDGGSSLGINDELKVIEYYNSCHSIHKVNKKLGYSRDYIRNILHKYDVKYDNNSLKNINENVIIEMYKELYEVKKVANKLNLSEKTVRKYLRNNNVEIYKHQHNRYIYIMYDIETQQEIKRFNDFTEIQNYLGIYKGDIVRNIKKVSSGEKEQYAGFYWKLIEKT